MNVFDKSKSGCCQSGCHPLTIAKIYVSILLSWACIVGFIAICFVSLAIHGTTQIDVKDTSAENTVKIMALS